MTEFELPTNLFVELRDEDGERRAWMAALPAVVDEIAERWSLRLGRPFQPGGQCAWVAPARDPADRDLVLKVGWQHTEARDEADGLQAWAGAGAVLVHDADTFDDTSALLLERCVPGTPLRTRPEPQQDDVIAALLQRLWHAPANPHPFRLLQEMCDQWADEFDQKPATELDPGIVRAGMELFRTLPATAERTVLLATDLHADNILAAQREPWLVIDPKPYVGDPTYDALQHMLNCPGRLRADPVGFAQRLAGLMELDAERLLLWLFARCVQESVNDVAAQLAP
jgi:streptomycin 6-kinase